ncbi:L,D-transpeptidase family protein [Paenibacillus allorhizosphaerae]|uniref:L,D-TPase catalytic domain-containing protein n=1 Tax=Paenibacillus allorhizosphaerae TaxID=2849866 RepID=A0ABN7TIN3_9BACL|nr:L,D-transpeptidase family protein [Paenibacillus allorhizosphaerae]CAG7632950.1 hypothetical protein PAECIP111802_01896 [Paenibacillus allorhizosphaerae]
MSSTHKNRKSIGDDNLVHLHKNVFISRGDSQYYEKVIQYLDPSSPEAHYHLAQQHEQRGMLDKALHHYKVAMKTRPSPYYYAAVNGAERMKQPPLHVPVRTNRAPDANHQNNTAIVPSYVKIGLILLLLVNLLLVAVLYGPIAVSKAVSVLKPSTVGKEVSYETAESPFLMTFTYGIPSAQVEKTLHQKAITLADAYPKHGIVIYGVLSAAPNEDNTAVPLTDEAWKSDAFVIAEYNPIVDRAVKIRFLHPDVQKLKPRTEAAANIVRTALQSYISDNGVAPRSIDQLTLDYPHNYLSVIPMEARSGSADVRTVFNGRGGWVYDRAETEPERMFYPNTEPADLAELGRLPFHPVTVTIDTAEHMLQLRSGEAVLARYPVGLGADNRTPEGTFRVSERVRTPLGKQPGVYGAAALGLGAIAIHGTSDADSIGQDRSLGCIRLSNENIEALFPLVPRGATVMITGGKATDPATAKEVHPLSQPLALLGVPIAPPLHGSGSDETAGNTVFHWLG